MATEQVHHVPGRRPVNVLDLETASGVLEPVLQRFRAGVGEPLIFGDGKPEGVIIPFDDWLDFLDAADEVAASQRVLEMTRQRLDTPHDQYISIEDLGLNLDDDPPERDTSE